MSSKTEKATKRLLRDLKEIENNPLETVYSQPLPNNLFVWHATVLAPKESRYHGIILNIKLMFDENYPKIPPKAVCYPTIRHPHVFIGFICLDMLSTVFFSADNKGWSSSYSCFSIILQLQSFLLDQESNQNMRTIKEDVQNSKRYANLDIGHDPNNGKIWPCAPHWNVKEILKSEYNPTTHPPRTIVKTIVENIEYLPGVNVSLEDYIEMDALQKKRTLSKKQKKKLNRRAKSEVSFEATKKIENLKDLPNELLIHILSYLNFVELKRASWSSNYLKQICENRILSTERELICFHSKVTYKEDTLGIGLSFHTKENGQLEGISSPLDLISKSAFFDDQVTKSVWGVVTTHWLPIYLNRKHGSFEELKQATRLIIRSYSQIFNSSNLDGPEVYIDLMCKLMNSMVVEIMKGNLHASIKSLYGYLYFHRWLIFLVQKFPQSLEEIQQQVKSFVMHEDSRKKSSCPNIGEFLPKLSVLGPSGLTWNYVKSSVIEESTIRKQLWNIKQFPMLANPHDKNDELRCTKSWEANNVSCKLMMFHVFFLRNVVEAYNDLSLEELGRVYDNNFGCPPKAKNGELLEDFFQREIFKIQNISSFEQYFQYIDIPNLNSRHSIARYLRTCVKVSERRGYHKNFHKNKDKTKKDDSTRPYASSTRSNSKAESTVDTTRPSSKNSHRNQTKSNQPPTRPNKSTK